MWRSRRMFPICYITLVAALFVVAAVCLSSLS